MNSYKEESDKLHHELDKISNNHLVKSILEETTQDYYEIEKKILKLEDDSTKKLYSNKPL